MSDDWRVYMERIVSRMLLKRDIGAFKDPIEWEGTDYLTVVSRPMDLTTVRNRLLDDMYNSREVCIQDVRLIWSNAKLYNKPKTKMYESACQMEESFEVMLKNAVTSEDERPITISAMHAFITNCHRIRREELREVILKLESLCPECIQKNQKDNKMNIEVDLISPSAFRVVNGIITSYLSFLGAAVETKFNDSLSDSHGFKRTSDTLTSNTSKTKMLRTSSSSSSGSAKKRPY